MRISKITWQEADCDRFLIFPFSLPMAHDHEVPGARLNNCSTPYVYDGLFHDGNDYSRCPLNIDLEFVPSVYVGDSALIAHAVCMFAAFILLMPLGTVAVKALRFKLHGFTQLAAVALCGVGFLFAIVPFPHSGAHSHGDHDDNLHSNSTGQHSSDKVIRNSDSDTDAQLMWWLHTKLGLVILYAVCVQAILGTALGRAKRCRSGTTKRVMHRVHEAAGALILVIGACAELPTGAALYTNLCGNGRFSNCVGHAVSAMTYIFYGGWLLAISLRVVQLKKRSIEFYECCLFLLSGVVNALSQHDFGSEWSHGDVQHVVEGGAVYILTGTLGLLLERRLQRIRDRIGPLTVEETTSSGTSELSSLSMSSVPNIFPVLTLLVTGLSMLNHVQPRVFQVKMHTYWGSALIFASFLKALTLLHSTYPSSSSAHSRFLFPFAVSIMITGVMLAGAAKPLLLLAEWRLESDSILYAIVLVCLGLVLVGCEVVLLELHAHLSDAQSLPMCCPCWTRIRRRRTRSGGYSLVEIEATGSEREPFSSLHSPRIAVAETDDQPETVGAPEPTSAESEFEVVGLSSVEVVQS